MYVTAPIINQRTEKTNDGRTPESGNTDCVPCSLASMTRGLVPSAALDGSPLSGDGLKDLVYGQGWSGLQDPSRYVAVLEDRFGVHLTPYSGAPVDLVAHAIACIRAGQPVLLSIPSDWNDNPPTSRYAHMVAGCGVDSSHGTDWDHCTLTAMNPWTAQYQTETLNWWKVRLSACVYKATWVMTREGHMGVPNGWHDDTTTGTLTAPNGVSVVRGFRDHILAATSWPAALVPVAGEYGGPTPGSVVQDFTLRLHWDSASGVTEQPGEWPHPAPPQPPDPTAQAAKAALAQVKTVLGEL